MLSLLVLDFLKVPFCARKNATCKVLIGDDLAGLHIAREAIIFSSCAGLTRPRSTARLEGRQDDEQRDERDFESSRHEPQPVLPLDRDGSDLRTADAIEPKRTCAVDRDIDRSTCCGADIVWFESERYEDETGCTASVAATRMRVLRCLRDQREHTHSYDDDCCCDECEARR